MYRFERYLGAASVLGALFVFSMLLPGSAAAKQEEEGEHEGRAKQGKYLFVWAGDQSRSNPDFLSVINFDQHSAHYGEVIKTVPLPGPGAAGNEPHHVGLSRDGKVLATGGLLSVLKGQPEIFFFDISNPNDPKFISAVNRRFPRSPMISNPWPVAAFWSP